MHISRFSLSYAPHTSEVYNNIGLNSVLKSLLQVSIDNFGSQENFLLQNYSVSNFSTYTVVVVIVVAAMAILIVVFIFHHC